MNKPIVNQGRLWRKKHNEFERKQSNGTDIINKSKLNWNRLITWHAFINNRQPSQALLTGSVASDS